MIKKPASRSVFFIIGCACLFISIALAAYSFVDEYRASKSAAFATTLMESAINRNKDLLGLNGMRIPDYILNPAMEMPSVTIDGKEYVGTLELHSLSLNLAVIKEWSYPNLKIAPCVYEGTPYAKNMIIAAHNYKSHFGSLSLLSIGDKVTFMDIDGNNFYYKVSKIETLGKYENETLKSGNWDLTLFTCTYGGKERITVRCTLDKESLPFYFESYK